MNLGIRFLTLVIGNNDANILQLQKVHRWRGYQNNYGILGMMMS